MENPTEIIAICSIVYAAASEIIGMSKLKQNSVLQSAMSVLGLFFGRNGKWRS